MLMTSCIITVIAAFFCCLPAFCDPIGYLETFDSNNMGWKTDEDSNANLFNSPTSVNWDSATQSVYANYPAATPLTLTSVIYADSGSASPIGTLAGNVDYSDAPGLSVWLKLSTTQTIPGVTFFLGSNKDDNDSGLSTSSEIWYAYSGASGLGTSWIQYTASFGDTWVRLRGSGTEDFSAALADVDAIGVVFTDVGQTQHSLFLDNFAVTPEPATLFMMGPLAGFLGWKVIRRRKKAPTAAA